MAVSAQFQTQLDRLGAYVDTLKAAVTDTGPQVDADNTAALAAELDAVGAPLAVDPNAPIS